MSQDTTQDDRTATVEEADFNGSAVYIIEAGHRRAATSAARTFWEDRHGSSPSHIVAELYTERYGDADDEFKVAVNDHSSGSLADSETISLDE